MPDAATIADAVGYEGMALIVFTETAILLGFLLPGDAVILAAGALAARGEMELWIAVPVLLAAAIAGEGAAFVVGRHFGPWLRKRDRTLFLIRRSHMENAQRFYRRHGAATLVLARFVGVARTFAPVAAGASRMPVRAFLVCNVAGGVVWVASMLLAGYAVGATLERLDLAFGVILAAVGFLSVAPFAVAWSRKRWGKHCASRDASRAAV